MRPLLLLLLAVPAGAASHKLAFKLLDGDVEYVRRLDAEELKQADSGVAGEDSGRPVLISAVVSKPSGRFHLVEYQASFDKGGRVFEASGALTLARGERLRVVNCDGFSLEIGLDAKGEPAWPAGDEKNYRLSTRFEREGRKRSCRATSRLETPLQIKLASARGGGLFTLHTMLSGEDHALALEHVLEETAPGSEKLTVKKTDVLTVGRKTSKDGAGYSLSWHAEAPPPKPEPRAAAAKAAAPAPPVKVYKPVPRIRLQRGEGIGINNLGGSFGGGSGSAPVVPAVQPVKPAQPEGEGLPAPTED